MKKLVTNIPAIICSAFIVEIFFIILSIRSCDWTWFSRSGGILTLLGGILAARRLIRKGIEQILHEEFNKDWGSVADKPCDLKNEEVKQTKNDITAAHLAFYIIVLGTLIWAFGDLINRFAQNTAAAS